MRYRRWAWKLGQWEGVVQSCEDTYLRAWYPDGTMVPNGYEREQAEHVLREEAEAKNARLIAKLRSLGINPD